MLSTLPGYISQYLQWDNNTLNQKQILSDAIDLKIETETYFLLKKIRKRANTISIDK